MLELTEDKVTHLNEIVAMTLENGKPYSDGFDLTWYVSKKRPEFSLSYGYHLFSLMKYYNDKYNRNWVELGQGSHVRSNHNTGYFYEKGGYSIILEEEIREHNIKLLTEQQLQKSIWQIKGWWIFVLVNAIISFLIAWLTIK